MENTETTGGTSRRQAQTEESRRLLLDAAAELFGEKGFRRTTFVDIAERAGISRGSIPWHFGNKQGLLEAVIDEQVTAVLGPIDADTDDTTDPLRKVSEFIRRPRSRLFLALLAEAVEQDSPVRAHHARLHAALRQAVEVRLPSSLPPDTPPGPLAALLAGAVIGVHVKWRISPEDVDLDAIGDILQAMLPTLD